MSPRHLPKGVVVERKRPRWQARPWDTARRKPCLPPGPLERSPLEHPVRSVDAFNHAVLNRVPVRADPSQRLGVDWDADPLHTGRGYHEPAANERAWNVE